MSLSSLIVQRDVATMRQVEEALARQVIYGGDLVTNLLEVARVDESVLTPLLAESMELQPAPAGELPLPMDAVRAFVPAEIAVQRSIVPLYTMGDQLVLAVAEALPAEVSDQLSFALGLRVEQLGAPAVRVWQAIARTYGIQLERRMARLIGRLSGDSTGGSLPPPLAVSAPPAPPAARSRSSRPPPRVSVPPPVGAGTSVHTSTVNPLRSGPARRSTTLTSFPATRTGGAASTSSMSMGRPSSAGSMPVAAGGRSTSVGSMSAVARPESPTAAAVVAAAAAATSPLAAVAADRHALLQRDVTASLRPGRRRRGPLTLEAARDEADEALDRDALLDLFFDFSRQFFDYAVLFLVQSDIAEGRDAFGSGASRERVLGIGVPLDLPSLLASAREKRLPIVASAPADGLDAVLLADLQRPRDVEVVVVPLVVRTRAVALLVADCGDAGIDRESIRQAVTFGGVVGKAFERIIVRRKLDGFVAGSRIESKRLSIPPPPPAVYEPAASSAEAALAVEAAPVGQAPRVEAPLLDVAPPVEAPSVEAPPAEAAAPPVEAAAADSTSDAHAFADDADTAAASFESELPGTGSGALTRPDPDGTRTNSGAATRPGGSNYPGRTRSSVPPPPAFNIATVRKISGPPIPREEPESSPVPRVGLHAAVTAGSLAKAPISLDVGAPFEADEVDDLDALLPPAPPPRDAEAIEPSPSSQTEIGEDSFDPSSVGPASAAIAVSLHRPPTARPVDPGLPLVIVDLETELGTIVDRLVQGDNDEAAEVELLRQGARAMPALMARFPGPVQFERARIATMPNPPRASECGVILRLVARERRVALPFVLEHLVDPDPEKRGWATHLLCELPYIEALPRLLERLRDEDAATRASAGHGVAAIARSHAGRVTQSLRELVTDGDVRERTAAIRAMGIVRDGSLVPTLIHGLGDGNEETVAAAHASLVQVTRQDFGADARPWLKWWEQNASRHRIEWLIDALTHEVAEVRRAAGEELRALSRQYFGYASDLPARDRERAQQRYRDWWITEGRTRHRRV